MLTLRAITKTYGTGELATEVLHATDLDVPTGQYLAIMGPSGSGKSTLMNIIGLLDVATSGTYSIDGIDVSTMTDDERAGIRNQKIGFVFQQFNLLARTTAHENVELPLLYSGIGARDRHARARQALERVGLGQKLSSTPNQLSGGQQQRVSIARALVVRPTILLADEPTGALDSKTTVEVLALFDELHREGQSIIMITHASEVAERAERAVRIFDGELSEGGLRQSALSHSTPATP